MFSFARSRRLRHRTRNSLLWLLALVVPFQCGAALWRSAAGPAHVHAPVVAVAPLLLQDVRRGGPALSDAAPPSAIRTAIHGHLHAERHRHLADDGSIVPVKDGVLDRADSLDDGGTASSGAFSGLVPLLAAWPAWQGLATAEALPAADAWEPSSHVGMPLERPPRTRLG